MKLRIFFAAVVATINVAEAQVMATVTDGTRPFAEGILRDYVVQVGSRTICTDPFVIGRYISCSNFVTSGGQTWSAESDRRVWVDTNGMLGAMVVIDNHGQMVCRDPMAWNQFRGSKNYIQCDK